MMKFKNISGKIIPMKISGEWFDLENDEIIDIPVYVGVRQSGLMKIESKPIKKVEEPKKALEVKAKPKSEKKLLKEKELKKLKKDGLNDYAAGLGLKSVNESMLKSIMIKKILEFQNEME